MELPVEQRAPYVDHRVPADHALLHRLDDALFDGSDELIGDRTAEDLVDEVEPLAASEGLDLDGADRVLPMAPGLLHVAAETFSGPADRLAEGDPGRGGRDLDAELPLHPLDLDVEVRLAH